MGGEGEGAVLEKRGGGKGRVKGAEGCGDARGRRREHDVHASTARAHRQTKRD